MDYRAEFTDTTEQETRQVEKLDPGFFLNYQTERFKPFFRGIFGVYRL